MLWWLPGFEDLELHLEQHLKGATEGSLQIQALQAQLSKALMMLKAEPNAIVAVCRAALEPIEATRATHLAFSQSYLHHFRRLSTTL